MAGGIKTYLDSPKKNFSQTREGSILLGFSRLVVPEVHW